MYTYKASECKCAYAAQQMTTHVRQFDSYFLESRTMDKHSVPTCMPAIVTMLFTTADGPCQNQTPPGRPSVPRTSEHVTLYAV